MRLLKQVPACSNTAGRWCSYIKHACALCLLLNENQEAPYARRAVIQVEPGSAGRLGAVEGALGAVEGELAELRGLGARMEAWKQQMDVASAQARPPPGPRLADQGRCALAAQPCM